MLFDGFTVLAQIINFLVLVWLLKRFLYGPIMRAVTEREERIARQIAEAEALKQQATEEAERFRRQNEELDRKRDEMLSQSRHEAEIARKEMISQARREVDEARARWLEVIRQEQDELLHQVRQRTGKAVASVSRRALMDLADATLEARMIEVLIRRIESLDDDTQARFAGSFENSRNQLLVRSAFEVEPALRQRIEEAVRQRFAADVTVEYEIVPELICGVEARVGDHKLAWTLDDYLNTLEDTLFEGIIVGAEEAEAEHE